MAIKGSLKEAGLADVCQLLALSQKTGCLSVTDRSRFGQVYFDRGRITYATIVNRRDRLGDLLVREGVIEHEQLAETIDAQSREPDRRLGELLLERGFLDAGTLTTYIQRQIEEAVYYLFTWTRGNFYFQAGKTPDTGEILIAVNPEMLLLEGARRVDEWSVIEKKIASLDLIFEVDRDRLTGSGVSLTPEQEAVVALLDGERTVEEVAEESGLGEFSTGKAVYGLIQAGFTRRVGRRDDGEATERTDVDEARNLGTAFFRTSMLDDARREFERVLRAEPDDSTARHYLALIALREADTVDAARRFTGLLETDGARPGVFLNLAYALRLERRFGDALRVLEEARGLAPTDPRVLLARGATLLFGGEPEPALAALAEYRRLLNYDALPPPTYYYCAALAETVRGRIEEADRLNEEGLGAHPASAPLLLLAGNIAERRADTTEAERYYQQAAEEDPALGQAHKNLGDLAHRRGLDAEAFEHYRRAAEIAPDLGDDLFTRLGDLHYRRKERDMAIRCWRKALELNPENEIVRNHLEVLAGAEL